MRCLVNLKIRVATTLFVNALWLSPVAQADVITCSFTEPFVTTVYSTNLNTLTITYAVESRHDRLDDMSFQIMKPGKFELWDAKHEGVQRLELSFRGSDGMSDKVYPYEVYWIPEKLHGGCTSNHLK